MKYFKFITFLFILSLVFLGIYQLNPPRAVGINAPLVEFSAGRAMKHLEVIAQKPHPINSPEHVKVRDYILKELTAMGLQPEVQKTTVVNNKNGAPFAAGTVHNVLIKLPGSNSTKAILLAAHYDSVANSPGASDDGAAVAAMLETVRALKVGSSLKNDVIFLFTDGEEPGLLGAIAFVEEHPWKKDVGLAVNFEARGNSGPSLMFETNSENGWLIQEFAKASVHPVTSSLFNSIYKKLPNDTDFTIFKSANFPGLNFAFINGVIYYHTAYDNLQKIDRNSLQHHGEYALALTRHFGNLDLTNIKQSDAVYFDIFASFIVSYPEAWVIPLTVLVVGLFFGVTILGFQKTHLSFSGINLGFLALFISIISVATVVTVIWWLINNLHSEYRVIIQGDTYNSNLYAIAFVTLAIAITSGVYIYFYQKTNIQNLTFGTLLWWLIFMVLTSIYLPGASYLFTLPLLLNLGGWGFIFATSKNYHLGLTFIILSVCSIPVIILFAPTIYLMFVALTISMAGVVMVMVVLLLGLLIPHFYLFITPHKWLLPATALLISLSLMIAGSFTAGFDANHPKPNSIFYALNADTGKAIWASFDEQPDEWTSQFLSQNPEKASLTEYLPFASRQFLKNQAPALSLAAPKIILLGDNTDNDTRTLRLQIISSRQGRIVRVYLDPKIEVLEATVNSKKIDDQINNSNNDGTWGLNYFGLPQEGIELTLTVKKSQSLKLKVVDQSDDLPEIPNKFFRQRPNYMMPTGFGNSDSTLVSKSFTL
ncbi:M28 family metallopeptidase [Nostocaceae cyanobacterium CENA369]|uniref:M28 family metallopeptidase n=1 Tax=Dendronalium phyllosphericum CENA369 TaxID=1725256 RepID=A0A8J7LDT1_9NOST|nr:M28 family metallopeptidase [Dendronalium phyllosphericum]MBH8572263.1 M28 family metallopeptidase [Dendronalium phyllosphericum CENA369]